MLTLGLETAGRRAGVALLDDDEVLAIRSAPGPHRAVLLPMIAETLQSQGLEPGELDLIGVARGPGSYTGLRIGVVTAKTVARATGATLLGVPTLLAMASQAPPEARRVMVALHAYKRRVLLGWFTRDKNGRLLPEGEPALLQAVDVDPADAGEAVITDAPELLVGLERWGATVPCIDTSAVAVAIVARARHLEGAADETYSLTPRYLRPPSITLKTPAPPSEP